MVYCVHDGHGGSKAVDKMVEWIETQHWSTQDTVVGMWEDECVMQMADMYYTLMTHVEEEGSGAVSITALCTPEAIYMAWVGDCEGCVFSDQKVLDTAQCCEIDLAEPILRYFSRAQSSPHSFSSEPKYMILAKKPITKTANVEKYCTRERAYVLGFHDADSQAEYEKIQNAHPLERLRIDSTYLVVGNSKHMLVDARLSGSVQPTRVLGDCRETMALRHPTVMRIVTANNAKRNLALCSDGAFSRGAFADLAAVCACALSPLRFVQTRFYRRGQEITERLLASGMLLRSSIFKTWPNFVTHLRKEFLVSMRDDRFYSTFEDYHAQPALLRAWFGCSPQHTLWLRACQTSIEWLEENVNDGQGLLLSGSKKTALLVAHLAVVMGSMDNVTVLLAVV